MREHPIIFSGEMVRAILEDRKTQMRRVMNQQPVQKGRQWFWGNCSWTADKPHCPTGNLSLPIDFCPYGQPGERLWVRETWREGSAGSIFYRADEEYNHGAGWKPSIHMSRRMSRIILEIVKVRVERIKDLTDDDAKSEGVACPDHGPDCAPRAFFGILWDKINGSRGYWWKDNPWVWVVKFKRIS